MTPAASAAVHTPLPAEEPTTRDVVLVVHGIGRKIPFETLQEGIFHFGQHRGGGWHVPIGHLSAQCDSGGYFQSETTGKWGYSEVFWADIAEKNEDKAPRDVSRWVGRMGYLLSALDAARTNNLRPLEGVHIHAAMNDTLLIARVSKFLLSRARVDTAGLVDSAEHFIVSYQLFSDFDAVRDDIVKVFRDRLTSIANSSPPGERIRIHILAHSLGSVVTIAGLADLIADCRFDVVDSVASLTTIGSPIDLYAVVHPEILRLKTLRRRKDSAPIRWINLVERADPIASSLTVTKRILRDAGADLFSDVIQRVGREGQVIDELGPVDIEYCRNILPGGAHLQYWGDPFVYGAMKTCAIQRGYLPRPPRGSFFRSALSSMLPAASSMALCLLTAALAVMWASALHLLNPVKNVGLLNYVIVIACSGLMCFGQVMFGSMCRSAPTAFLGLLGIALVALGAWTVQRVLGGTQFLLSVESLGIWMFIVLVSIGLLQCIADMVTDRSRMLGLVAMVGSILIVHSVVLIQHAAADEFDTHEAIRSGVLLSALCAVSWWLATLWWRFSVVWTKYVVGRRHIDFLAKRWVASL